MSLSIESIAKSDLGGFDLWKCEACGGGDPCYALLSNDDGGPLKCLFCDMQPCPTWEKVEQKERVMGEEQKRFRVWSFPTAVKSFDKECEKFLNEECGDDYKLKFISAIDGITGECKPHMVIAMELKQDDE